MTRPGYGDGDDDGDGDEEMLMQRVSSLSRSSSSVRRSGCTLKTWAKDSSICGRRVSVAAQESAPGMADEGEEERRKAAVELFTLVGRMKTTLRTGWVERGVPHPESVADHSYRMAMMALLAAPLAGLDASKCACMALAHDLAEAIVGDIAPSANMPKAEKSALEASAMRRIADAADAAMGASSGAGERVASLWREYEEGRSPEAVFMKDLDKLEMILQAHEYEVENERYDLGSFFESTKGKIKTDVGKGWAHEVIAQRGRRHRRRRSGGAAAENCDASGGDADANAGDARGDRRCRAAQ